MAETKAPQKPQATPPASPAQSLARFHHTDMTAMPTRADVMDLCGVSRAMVVKWEKQEKLHGVVDAEGTVRFAWDEVHDLAKARGVVFDPDEMRQRAFAQLELRSVTDLVRLITKPRQDIDTVYQGLVDGLRARVSELEGRLSELQDKAREALDNAAAREVAKLQVTMSETRQNVIWNRLLGTFDKFVHSKGVPFLYAMDLPQLEVLIEALGKDGFWTADQLKVLKDVHQKRSMSEAPINGAAPGNAAAQNGAAQANGSQAPTGAA